ncbi:MAG: nucleotidyl transferase AbiEii/AbiGii toxin family protein [Acidimicrobiales bacterium]
MIPPPVISRWRREHPWSTEEQVEQDLLLSQLAVLLAKHDELGHCLVWRGGTCLHKLHLSRARRYSEDLDYVLVGRAGPTGWLVDAIRAAVVESPLREVSRNVAHGSVKVLLEGDANSGVPLRVKIEVNTDEVPPALALTRIAHRVDTRWWSGGAEIPTFAPAELVGTKFRALAQRRKGRDLWDMWLARWELPISDTDLAVAGDHYLSACGVSPATFRQRLWSNAADQQFRDDLELLAVDGPAEYEVHQAATELILWSDQNLDPLYDARRSSSAIARERARWARNGWAPGNLRCPHHHVATDTAIRCPHWYPPGGSCPDHAQT